MRMNVPLRYVHVAAPGKICRRPRVHVGRPSGQARVPQSLQLETLKNNIPAAGPLAQDRRMVTLLLAALQLLFPGGWSLPKYLVR